MSGLVDGKVGLITGAAAGIGRATAIVFAREGGTVVVADIDRDGAEETVRVVEAAGGRAMFVECDVTQASEVEALVQRTVDTYGRLDCAHNNAAWEGHQNLVTEESEQTFDRLYATNLKAVWLCMRSEIAAMTRTGGGTIVNAGSLLAFKPFELMGPYCAIKHGVAGLTKTAAIEYATKGVRINLVSPGLTRTPGAMRAAADTPFFDRYLETTVPAARWVEPEEVAETVVFMLCERSSGMYGGLVMVDAGGLCR
jgi:NAD(P)-dependent dehydrogenase (short-subunit alcohol dehydrogenase family)